MPCLTAWADSLGGINYPLLSDFWPHGRVARQYGVLREEGYSERALFIVDRSGRIRYIDVHDIENQPSNDELLDELRRIDPEAAAREPSAPEARALPRGGIVMYCARWCPDCRRASQWLGSRGLSFVEVDVYRTPGAADQVRQWADGKLITPTFDIDGEILVNPSQERLSQVLG